jgi:heme-degrading monooxygenase HmoA
VFAAVFEYLVEPSTVRAFEAAYARDGAWSELFGRAPGYLGTELLSDRSRPGRYLVVDRWESPGDHRAFHRAWGAEFRALSEAHVRFYRREVTIGEFVTR